MAIPSTLHGQILDKAGEGLGVRAITEWLLEAHGVKSNRTTVSQLLKGLKADRAVIATAVVREELSTTLTADIHRLERLIKKTLAKVRREEDVGMYCRLVDQTRKLIETKLRYSGAADGEDKQPAANADSPLMLAMSRLRAEDIEAMIDEQRELESAS